MTALQRLLPLAVVAACLGALYHVQRSIDGSQASRSVPEEYLYLADGDEVKRLALGYHALLADLYWLRAVQYFGTKLHSEPNLLAGRSEKLKLLYPLIDVTTTLDPKFEPPYRFGAYFVHDYVDPELGIKLLDKAIRNNPDEWHFYQDKAFLVWTAGDCEEAAAIYDEAAKLATAPVWLATMGPTVRAECGDIESARAIYDRLLDELGHDEYMGPFLRRKRLGLDAQDEVAALRDAVSAFEAANGRLPLSLAQVLQRGFLSADARVRVNELGQPVDPLGVPYEYNSQSGKITPGSDGVILPVRVFKRRAPDAAPAR